MCGLRIYLVLPSVPLKASGWLLDCLGLQSFLWKSAAVVCETSARVALLLQKCLKKQARHVPPCSLLHTSGTGYLCAKEGDRSVLGELQLACSNCGSSCCFPEVANCFLQCSGRQHQPPSPGSAQAVGTQRVALPPPIKTHRQASVCPSITPLALGPHSSDQRAQPQPH